MRAEKREARMREIEAVAYQMLGEVGVEGTSMLAVAKRAKASNETMYRWYGDKNGLFQSMVRVNAGLVRTRLEALVQADLPPLEVLQRIAPVLLGMLLSDAAIALNRAAAADASGSLGQVIAEEGRAQVLPLIRQVLVRAVQLGDLRPPQGGDLGGLFMSLLVGDQQIRRVIGVLAAPTTEAVEARADAALGQFRVLCVPR